MAITRYHLAGVELDYTEIEIPLFRGWQPLKEPIVIRQLANRYEELKGLPYICDLEMTNTAEVGNRHGAAETTVIKGLRLLDVIQIDDEVCEVHLTDLRKDLADRVCPVDVNQRWKDGYLNGTHFPFLPDLFEYLAPLIQTLQDVLAEDAFDELPKDSDFEIPDGESIAGLTLPDAGQRVTELLAMDPVVGADEKLRFVRRGSTLDLMLQAYNWMVGATPSWNVESRTPRGLPLVFRFHYWEKHALLFTNAEDRSTSSNHAPVELQHQLEMVFAFDGRYGTLRELFEFYGYAPDLMDDSYVGNMIMTENFEGTPLEAGTSQNAREVIGILKRDRRLVWRIRYPDQLGRRGGWVNLGFGNFQSVTDKDGNTEYTGDISAAPVRMEYTEYLAELDEGKETQTTIDDNIVIQSVRRDQDGVLPVAPFTAAWEGGMEGEVFRLTPKPDPTKQQAVWPGVLNNNSEAKLAVRKRNEMIMDDGQAHDAPFEVTYIPLPSDCQFGNETALPFELNVLAVGMRRMPNDATRWHVQEQPGFTNGDVPVMEPEVSEELFCLRGEVDPARGKNPTADGLGEILNEPQLIRDSERRARVLRDRLGVLVGGAGTAIGTALLQDLNHPHQAITSLTVIIDGVTIVTHIVVGKLDDEEARDQRKRIREVLRKASLGGKVMA
jgi:hypothetical protein